jgi:hypothetical protein
MALAFSLSASAQSIDKFVYRKGDVWQYKVKTPDGERDRREQIVEVGDIVVVAVSGDRTETREYDKSGNLLAESRRTFQPRLELYNFPLTPGKKWTQQSTIAGGKGKYIPVSLEASVMDWEEIIVPAGKFRALRVDYQIDFGGGRTGKVLRKAWLSPEVGRPVKLDTQGDSNRGDTAVMELVNFKPAN